MREEKMREEGFSEKKIVERLRKSDELIGVRIKCEFEVIWHKSDFETEGEAISFKNDLGGVIEAANWEFYDLSVNDLEVASEEILEFVDVKINVCHKCGLARQVLPKGIDWPRCRCIGQTWFSYELKERTMEEAKKILEEKYEDWLVLYERQSREVVEFQALMEEYCIGEDGKLDMTKVRRDG